MKGKRFIASVLTLVLSITIAMPSYASQNMEQALTYDVDYQMDGMNVIEEATFFDGTNILKTHRVVTPSGSATLTITLNGESKTSTQQVDYTLFKQLAENNGIIPFNLTRASNVHDGNIFNHTFVTNMSRTFTSPEVTLTLSSGVTILVGMLIDSGLYGGAAGVISNVIFTLWNETQPHHSTVNYSMYEVTFKADNGYYCFCHHYTIRNYDSGNHQIGNARTGTWETVGA